MRSFARDAAYEPRRSVSASHSGGAHFAFDDSERLGLRLAGAALKFVEHAEFHGRLSLYARKVRPESASLQAPLSSPRDSHSGITKCTDTGQ